MNTVGVGAELPREALQDQTPRQQPRLLHYNQTNIQQFTGTINIHPLLEVQIIYLGGGGYS